MKKSILRVVTKEKDILYVACDPHRSFFRMVQLASWYGCYFELTSHTKKDMPKEIVLTLGKLESILEEKHFAA